MTEPRTESRWNAFLDHPRIAFNVDTNRQFALQWLEDAEAEIRAEAAEPYRRVVEAAVDRLAWPMTVDEQNAVRDELRAALPVVVKDEAERE